MFALPLLLLLPACSALIQLQPPVFPGLPSIGEMVSREGLSSESFLVTTEDGYLLWVVRLGNSTGPPVLLQHGILLAPDSWLTGGRQKDLGTRIPSLMSLHSGRGRINVKPETAVCLVPSECKQGFPGTYMMADSGYDVYLGTFRGTTFCEGHTEYPKTDARFWNYTFHEQGLYDLPATIDAILDRTGAQDLIYIGHSLGTTNLLVLASTRPEYNKKLRAAFLLSPIAFAPRPFELGSPIVRFSLANRESILGLLSRAESYEVLPRTVKTIEFLQDQCTSLPGQGYCMDLLGLLFGENRSNLDKENFGYQFSFAPAGTSVYTLLHLSQLYYTNEFKYFDFGCSENLKKYNSCKPPHYRLDRISTPIYMFWSRNDLLISEWPVMRLASKLPNLVKVVKAADDKFTHVDGIIGKNAKEQLYQPILKDLAGLR